jgi:hypothetical protein
MDEEKSPLAHDKGGKHCGYMTTNMTEIFNSLFRGVRSLPITAIASFTFYKFNEWFVKCLVDAQMVKRDHSDYVVAPNIYLDIKRNQARADTQLALTFKLESTRLLKLEGRHLAVNIVGPNGIW